MNHADLSGGQGIYYEITIRVHDLIWRCLAEHMPDRLSSGHFGSVCATFIGGTHPDTGRQYTIIEPQLGGWGASSKSDGNSAIFCGFHGETYNCPAEINEARNGLIIDRMELNTDPGGEGRFSGGRGIKLDYRIRADDSFLTVGYTRSKFPAWSLEGGEDGTANYVDVIRKDGSTEQYAFVSGLEINKDDVVRIVTGNGGGLGDPKDRDPAAVREDIRNELISAERAAEIYGLSS